jgi:DNA-nicking Smr family endonuclease
VSKLGALFGRAFFSVAYVLRVDEEGQVEMPITAELDLHTFRPQDLGDLIPEYLEACRAKGIFEVRVIHGKGIGNVKRSVEAILPRLPFVERFTPASTLYGGAGATIVRLKPVS